MTKDYKYTLTISLNVLRHLGINLYSNIPAVLSEVVANSWDADAEKVEINIDSTAGIITIVDDGCGMTENDINNKYLKVGYRRRQAESPITNIHNRHVFGRKGIGKLSLFSIAEIVEVHSVKKDENGNLWKSGFVMDAKKIEKVIRRAEDKEYSPDEGFGERREKEGENKERDYHPEVVKEGEITIEKGAKIILRDLKKDISKTEPYLKRRLARRFSTIGKEYNFSVFVNGKEITVEDRDYFKKIEYLWQIGEVGDKYKKSCRDDIKVENIDGIVDEEQGYKITGWAGTLDEQKSIEEGDNTIVVLAWGKLIHEDILKDIKVGGVFSKYLIGEIRADFFDYDELEDMVTTGRQNVQANERFVKLKEYVQGKILKTIGAKWEVWRKEDATKKALENPKVKEWFNMLGSDRKKYAKKLFAKIESFPVSDPGFKKELYKHGIMAFETLTLKDSLSTLDKIKTEDQVETLIEIVKHMDTLEAAHYHQIVKNRMGVLKKFQERAPIDKEKVIQQHIFDHLWLLDPSWERASTDARMEQSVMKEFRKLDAKLSEDEKAARIDIRYRTAAGKHIIIELKKYTASVKISALIEQIQKYKNALKKCLERHSDRPPIIEIICILGSSPTPKEYDATNRRMLAQLDARYITYDQLITQTRDSYRDWLDTEEKIDKIMSLVDSL